MKDQEALLEKIMGAIETKYKGSLMSAEVKAEQTALQENSYITKYQGVYRDPQSKLRNSWRSNHE
jgi:hypothetical protein